MNEAYDLQRRLQELAAMSGVSLRNFKALHHVSYYTLYQFLKEPSLARPRTLTSVRLICDFLNSGLKSKLLPLNEKPKDMCEAVDKLYKLWWNNGKKFPDANEQTPESLTNQVT